MSTVAWALAAISMLVASVALAIARRARTAEAEAARTAIRNVARQVR